MVIATFMAFNTYADYGSPSSLNALSRLKPMMKDKTSWVCEDSIMKKFIKTPDGIMLGETEVIKGIYALEWNPRKPSKLSLKSTNETLSFTGLIPDNPGVFSVLTEDFSIVVKLFPNSPVSIMYGSPEHIRFWQCQ